MTCSHRSAARLAGLLCALVLLALLPGSAGAQGARITGVTTVRFFELRPLIEATISRDSTTPTGIDIVRQGPDGGFVDCQPDETFCRFSRTS